MTEGKGNGNGFIKLYRSMLDWEWWDDINTFRLFVTILMMANWKDKKWHGKKIKRGSFWTSLQSLADASGLSVRQVRVSLDKLILTNEVTSKVTNSGRLITVVNYGLYQDYDGNVTNEMTSDKANERQTRDKPVTTTKERKESKEYKECFVSAVSGPENEQQNFDIWSRLSEADIDRICDRYPNTGTILIDEVAAEVREHKREIKSPARYILGYATRKKWDDDVALRMPWEV